MKKIICMLAVLLAVGSLAFAEQSPREVVELWESCYGTAGMDRCGPITTPKMRDDKPVSVWIYDTWKQLDLIEYQKEKSELLKEEIDENSAIVVLQVRISSAVGSADQKELYKLIKVGDTWLIDDLIVGDEVLEEESEEL